MSNDNELTVKSAPQQQFAVHLVIPEKQARALDALTGYDIEKFLEFFYEKMGKAYMEPYEKDFRDFILACHKHIPIHLKKFDAARELFIEVNSKYVNPNTP